ncbi:hypothetical protein GCM10011519_16710 [Marmoricola endophyticus]|uniref:Thioesterase family protein n=1 Tax=Marmoricola endophyticus TaxID=2040280 RepID=A0A917F301_9ACTN|nr:thioesterase family protein [Marmoricola endophyticus]GGF43478.1 hypothetical protein GCM10011519_16710 [Marmoricola endophyticus]
MKSPDEPCWYLPDGTDAEGRERFVPTVSTAGPWTPDAEHGGPPAALLGRATEQLLPADRTVARYALDLLGPIGLGPLAVSAQVLRPGRTVSLLQAELHDESTGRCVAVARSWSLPAHEDGPGEPAAPGDRPDDGVERGRPAGWGSGYLDAVDWRWLAGGLEEPGAGAAWMRPKVPLVAGEAMSPLQRVLACVDSASGVSAALDIRRWAFMNVELTVTFLRPAEGDWVRLDAATTLGPGAVGSTTGTVSDLRGEVARSTQTLLLQRR